METATMKKFDTEDAALAFLGLAAGMLATGCNYTDEQISKAAIEAAAAGRVGFRQARNGISVGKVIDGFLKKDG